MKGLKKLALATAVAAAPFAQAELTAMDDSLLAEMTGQAGITIDVDLDMHIDAIKYVDQDGNTKLVSNLGAGDYDVNGNFVGAGLGDYDKVAGTQGAVTVKGLTVDNNGGTAHVYGITVDADGADGLVMGLNQIGGFNSTTGENHGIDITVDAVMINDGSANLHMYEEAQAQTFVDGGTGLSGQLTVAQIKYAMDPTLDPGTSGALATDAQNKGTAAFLAGQTLAAAETNLTDTRNTEAQNAFGQDYADLSAGDQATVDATAAVTTAQSDRDTADSNATAANVAALAAQDEVNKALAVLAPAGAGNIGGFVIEDFRNYIENSLVEEYNARFDMALRDSDGNVNGVANSAAAGGRYVRGEIVINGTGNYVEGTSGLRISGEFGGAIDKAAWVDDGGEFGVADLGFFHGVDTDLDGISDTIEGMHFSVDIDVVDNHTSSVIGTNMSGNDIAIGDTVSALRISNMEVKGTIMMGDLYVGDTSTGTSLGSVLIKDIDMTGTSVYIYGH